MRSALLCHGLMLVAAPAAAQTFVHGERDGILAQIPAPPNDSSIAGQADLDAVLLVQTIRSPSDEAGRASMRTSGQPIGRGAPLGRPTTLVAIQSVSRCSSARGGT